MVLRKPLRRRALGIACALLALGLGGCGDDEGSGTPAAPGVENPTWSAPAGPDAAGSPDGEGAALRTAEALMARLLRRVGEGRGPSSDPTFGQDVDAVAAVLWEPDAAGAERVAAQVHVQLASIAGDVASALAAEPPREPDATERKIHAAWMRALGGTPDAYRAWCAGDGVALIKEREEAIRRLLEK